MPGELLKTKLIKPQVPPHLLPRKRLVDQFNEGLRGKMTLISAPPGFGKTALVVECSNALNIKFGWFSIDKDDNDPSRFWSYFIAALQTLQKNLGQTAQQMLRSPKPAPIKTVLTALLNEISGREEKTHPYILVLDDYHLINNNNIHDDISFLVDHLPAQLHLVICTRADPQLPIPRWRVCRTLNEIRADDLRFTQEETALYFRDLLGIELNPDEIIKLDNRIEGWIASIQMVAVSLKHRKDAVSFIRAFSSSCQYVMDYLFTEVFSALSKDIQSFLLKTSVLDNLNASLCNAVAGISDSASILHHLFQSNLLLSSLDDPTEWYRYHHLMSDLLQQRLRLKMPELVPQLHARASQWYEKNQMAPQAIHHALSGGSFERAASLVENTNDSLILRGEVNTVIKWMDSFSEDIMSNRPYLCVLHATALLYSSGDIRLIEKRINQALVHKDNETIKGEIAALRAMVALLKGDLKRSGAYLQESLAALSQDSILFRTIASANLALLHVWRGEIAPAITLFEGICKKGSDTGSIMMTVLASRRLASLFVMQAKLKEAKKVHEDVLLLARDSLGNPLPVAAYAYIGLGDLYREWDELDAALEYTNKGNELMKNWQEAGAMLGYIALSQVKAAQEDPDGATRAIESALRAAKKYKATEVDDILVEVYQARLNIRLGKLEAAAQWVQKREAMEPLFLNTEQQSETFYLREMELITLARYYLALGKNVGVIRIADYLIPAADKLGQVGIRIELLLIKALALFAQGKNHDAQVALEAALSLAEPSGYVRLFIDEGEAILKLLQQSAVRGISSRYATRLIAAFVGSRHKTTQRAAERREGVSPKEALSNRELEIIRLVGGGLSNKEIAGHLFISIGTVKKHIYNICGKFNASNRTQAAARARELGLAE